jgi:hypothetical protein
MGSSSSYFIPLIRSAEGAMPPEDVKEGGKFLFVITGDLAGATIDLRVKYSGHPEEVVILGAVPEAATTEVWLPVGTEVRAAIMGGAPQSVNATLILVG